MNPVTQQTVVTGRPDVPAWGAVVAMTLGVFGLVTAEFLPASLLTPIAFDLGISEGAAGQAVTVTAVFGFAASLLISAAARGTDRRRMMMVFSLLLIASNLMVAFAQGLVMLLAGRALLGIALGGFWAMSTAVTMRLVPPALVPRALSILMSGVSAATVFAAPIGSYLGEIIGWRGVFLSATVLGVIALLAQWRSLPRMRPAHVTKLRTLGVVLVRPGIGLGMLAVLLVFGGHFVFFIYLRAYLETGPGFSIEAIATILLGFGIANFFGTLLAGRMVQMSLRLTLMLVPLSVATLAFTMYAFGGAPIVDVFAVILWGLIIAGVPVSWSSWIARTVPDEAESAGGLFVASIQLAIALGAGLGGIAFDLAGGNGMLTLSGAVLLAAAFTIMVGVRTRAAEPAAA